MFQSKWRMLLLGNWNARVGKGSDVDDVLGMFREHDSVGIAETGSVIPLLYLHQSISFLYCLLSANIKIKVKCNQTGKVFITNINKLLDEECDPIDVEEVEEGSTVYWEDEDMDAYPVTVLKVIGESEHSTDSIAPVIGTKICTHIVIPCMCV